MLERYIDVVNNLQEKSDKFGITTTPFNVSVWTITSGVKIEQVFLILSNIFVCKSAMCSLCYASCSVL